MKNRDLINTIANLADQYISPYRFCREKFEDALINAIETNWIVLRKKPTNENTSDVSGDVHRPPLGLIPKKIHDEQIRIKRLNDVRRAIGAVSKDPGD